VFGLPYLEEHK